MEACEAGAEAPSPPMHCQGRGVGAALHPGAAVHSAEADVTLCRRASRSVQDAVWGALLLPPLLWQVIETPVVQRLRDLRQTGWLFLLFPCAEHSRFPHSLGTAHLANQLLKCLAEAQPELAITPAEHMTVLVAALCHDLGHGPFSHSFETFMRAVGSDWTHEQQTVRMVKHMVATEPGVAAALAAHGVSVHTVCEIIMGGPEHAPPGWVWEGPAPGRQFLFQVVASNACGLDVDKLDYISRDHVAVNVACTAPPDALRLMRLARVVGGVLAWPVTEMGTVSQVFHARQQLHRQTYQHPFARAVELMVVRAMIEVHAAGTVVDRVSGATLAGLVASPEVFLRARDKVILNLMDGEAPEAIPARAAALFLAVKARRVWGLRWQEEFVSGAAAAAAAADAKAAAAADGADDTAVDLVCVHRGKGDAEPLDLVPWFHATPTPRDPWVLRLVRLTPHQFSALPAKNTGPPCVYIVRAYACE